LLIIDRQPWALELNRRCEGRLALVGRSSLPGSEVLLSEVVPLSFQLVAGADRPQIEVVQPESARHWRV